MVKRAKSSADSPVSPAGKQYHVGVGPGDIAPRVLLVGDPARAERVARRFQKRRGEWRNREFVTITVTDAGPGFMPAIHVLGCRDKKVRRGWPGLRRAEAASAAQAGQARP